MCFCIISAHNVVDTCAHSCLGGQSLYQCFTSYEKERTSRLTLIIPVSDRDLTKFTGELITCGRHSKCPISHLHLHSFPIILQPEYVHHVAHNEISPETFFSLRQICCVFHISFHLFQREES